MSKLSKALKKRNAKPISVSKNDNLPTKELLAKKNAGLTEEPIDLLRNFNMITDDQYQAAIYFRVLFTKKFGLVTVQAQDFLKKHKSSKAICLKRRQSEEILYKKASSILQCHGLLKVISNIAIYNISPTALKIFLMSYHDHKVDTPESRKDLKQIVTGLDLLISFFQNARDIKKFT